MLGRFLEFSLATPDIRASLDFYSKLGLSQTEVGDAWSHPYAVVTDGRICLGLHQTERPCALTFVKPDLLRSLPSLENFVPEFEFLHLGDDAFNEVGWLDPSGQLVRLVEARTFSPSKRPGTELSRCGYFQEIVVPTSDLEKSKIYWEQLGFVGIEELDDVVPHVSCTSDHVDLGLYDTAIFKRAGLRFEVDDVTAAVAALTQSGISPTRKMPVALKSASIALLIAPEGTPIVMWSTA